MIIFDFDVATGKWVQRIEPDIYASEIDPFLCYEYDYTSGIWVLKDEYKYKEILECRRKV